MFVSMMSRETLYLKKPTTVFRAGPIFGFRTNWHHFGRKVAHPTQNCFGNPKTVSNDPNTSDKFKNKTVKHSTNKMAVGFSRSRVVTDVIGICGFWGCPVDLPLRVIHGCLVTVAASADVLHFRAKETLLAGRDRKTETQCSLGVKTLKLGTRHLSWRLNFGTFL